MKRLSIFMQWLVLAAILGFVGYYLWRPIPQPDYSPETWHDWDGVTVLSFPGITRWETSTYPSEKRLAAHLTALRDAGYRTVLPKDVVAYLKDRAPLPEKALLLIFEGGRKEAFIRATPILQRTGFTAVITVPTMVMDQWGGFYLKQRDLARVSRLPQWNVGSMGHRAIESIPTDDSAESGRFLAQRIRRRGNEETADAFRNRIAADYAISAHKLKKATGHSPILYLYPFSEAGQGPDADPLAEAANREAVTRNFELAFIGGSNPFNGPGSDPWTLTRLRVPGTWTPEQLLAELAASRPRTRSQDAIGRAGDWVFDQPSELRNSTLNLSAGANAWLRGSDGWTDVDLSAKLDPGLKGSASLYARYTGPRSWLRVTSDADGLRVQERLEGILHTLYLHPPTSGTQTAHQIRLRVRNNRAWVWQDDHLLSENIPLSPATCRGRVGLGSERSNLRVSAFSARPLPTRWALVNSIRRIPAAEQDQIQAIVPIWFRTTDPVPSVSQTAQQDLLQTAVAGIHTLPLLIGGGELNADAARTWATAIDAELIRANVKLLVPTLAVEGPAAALAVELRNLGYRITHVLTPAQARVQGRSIAQVTPDEILVVNGRGPEAEQVVAGLLRLIPPNRLALREANTTSLAPDIVTARRLDSRGE